MTNPTKRPKIKTNRGFIMSSGWYTQIGNHFHNWSSSASQLFGAAMILRQEREKERRRISAAEYHPGKVSVAIGTNQVELLLTAFGLEALLKAVWLNSGNTLVDGGKYVGLPCERKKRKRRWHDLVAICDDTGIALDQSQRHILKTLSDVGRYHGRYPVATHWEHMEPIFYWSEEWDVAIGQVVTRLWRQLEFPASGGVPIGGAPLPED